MNKVFILLIFPFLAWSQEITFVEKIDLEADTFIGVNSFNETFYIKDQVLYKKTATSLFNFKDFQLGEIQSVDIINPMNIAVYYGDFNTVVLLDNKLTEIERINFNDLRDFINTSNASLSANNSLWIFNIDLQQLELYNYRTLNRVLVSQPIHGDVLSQISNFNYCYILTEEKIRAYNIYGSLLSEIDNDDFEKLILSNERLLAIKNNEIFYISNDAREFTKIKSPEINKKDLQLTQDFLYIYNGKKLHTFKLTLPK